MGNACKSAGRPVQNAWDNHFSAFGTRDVEKILLDYTAQSVITIYDQSTGKKTVHTGLEGARACFEGFFESLSDMSDLSASVQTVKEARKHEPGNVFLVWKCPASGYIEATDTFIFDASSRILRQNVVFTFKDPKGDVAKIDAETVEPAAAEVLEETAAPVEAKVEEPAAAEAPKKEAPAPVEPKVEEPTAAEAPIGSGPVHEGCANQFSLCSGSSVAKDAEVIVPAAAEAPKEEAATPVEAKVEEPAAAEKPKEEAAAPVEAKVEEPGAAEAPKEEAAAPVEAKVDEPAAAEAPKEEAAAPVEAKVEEPAAAEAPKDKAAAPVEAKVDEPAASEAPKEEVAAPVEAKVEEPAAAEAGSGPVHNGWANHFKAFGDQDVETILKDYVAESEITVVNQADGSMNTFMGLEGVRSCFEGLFKSLHNCSDMAAPVIHVEEIADGKAGQVFLIWSCPASGYQRATDTFIFNSAGKITRQHVVVYYVPAAAEAPKEEAAVPVEAKVEPVAAEAPKEEAAAPVEAKVEPAAAEAPKEEAAAPVVS